MFSKWHRVAPITLLVVFALCTDGMATPEPNQEGEEFIPALNEPCGVNCPDPDAPLSRVNHPPRDDNLSRSFVATETGLKIVQNPHWNRTVAAEDGMWCGVYCRDPYAPAGIANQLRRNDAERIILEFVPVGDEVYVVAKQNPHWVWRAENEAIEAITLHPPLPLLGLGGSSTEVNLGAEESGNEIVSSSMDRTGVAYHASGNEVFQPLVLQTIGGVLSQGSVAAGRNGRPPKVEFALGLDGVYPGYVLVSDGVVNKRYRIAYDELVLMALFVDGGGTSLYTLWGDDQLPAYFQQVAGFAKYDVGQGFVAIEFAATRFADALYFLDTCNRCVAFPDDNSEASVKARQTGRFGTEAERERRRSYINADVGSAFEVEETGIGAIKVHGDIFRFFWSADAGTGQLVSVDRKQPIVRPDELRSNVDRWLAEFDDVRILGLMAGFDERKKASGKMQRRRLADAYFLFETLALLRASKLHWPEDWSVFMAVLSSKQLVHKNREPWETYTEIFCGVYPDGVECTNRD